MKLKIRIAGLLFVTGIVVGIFSIVPSIDCPQYLTEAAKNNTQVIMGAVCQFIISLTYSGIAFLLYPILKKYDTSLALGFLTFRIIASTLLIIGTIVLLSILVLSKEFAKIPDQNTLSIEVLGNVLKMTRDYINHVFMILVLCTGNFLLYIILLKSKLLPKWFPIWGLFGTLLSAIASFLILFQVIEIITPEYLILNAPTAIIELSFGMWLIFKGFDKKVLLLDE